MISELKMKMKIYKHGMRHVFRGMPSRRPIERAVDLGTLYRGLRSKWVASIERDNDIPMHRAWPTFLTSHVRGLHVSLALDVICQSPTRPLRWLPAAEVLSGLF